MIKQKNLGPWLIFILMFIPVFILQLVANHFTETNKELNTSTPTYALSIENHSFCTTSYGSKAICGTILNNTNHSYRSVSVDINLYDESGALIGNTYESIRDLDAGRRWKFQSGSLDDKITGYSIKTNGY